LSRALHRFSIRTPCAKKSTLLPTGKAVAYLSLEDALKLNDFALRCAEAILKAPLA